MRTDEKNTVQNIYRIEVTDNGKTVWDTGMQESRDSVLVPYEGELLCDETLYTVKVTVWDNYGRAGSAETTFETGVFDPQTFRAEMITHDFEQEETACPVFYKNILLKGDVKKARLYATAQGVYEFGGLKINIPAREVFVDGERLNLRPKEYDLLFFLVENQGIVFSRDTLLERVWGFDFMGDDRTVDAQIKMLRHALGDYRRFIVTYRGAGYKFEDQ